MRLRDSQVGDRVTVRWNGIEGFTTITKIGKRNIKTADGREWKMSGYRWGSESYSGPWISPLEPTDENDLREQREERRRRQLARRISEVKWWDLPMPVLQSVASAVFGEAQEG